MDIQVAVELIKDAVVREEAIWADLGAGTGTFTQALQYLLPKGKVYAVDKSPHALWRLPTHEAVPMEIVDADFTKPLTLPPLDGILMANALHYVDQPADLLKKLLPLLKPGGTFLLVEYETKQPRPPWIPYPIPFDQFFAIAADVGLTPPKSIGRVPSMYGHDHIYASMSQWIP
ncbi:MAG: class I SAM-dependent methyltransferase [Saprospiraceae bacterium]|nr:class I SAM-dependent methyltransferase [Saprospiraceae bacterium]